MPSPAMDRRRTRTMVSRLLRQSILELCKASVPQEQGINIDGIVCISIGNEDDQIVVKVHEQLGALRTISDATSSQSHPRSKPPRSIFHHDNPRSTEPLGPTDYEKKRQNLHLIASAASAKKMRVSRPGDSNDVVGSSTSTPKKRNSSSPTPSQSFIPDISLLTTIKTEVLSDDDASESSATQVPQPSTSTGIQNCTMEKYLGNASLDTVVFRDLECEHCKLLLPTFEELKAHNDQEHKANTCGYCWRSFLNLGNYQQHLRSHRKMRVGTKHSKEQSKDMHKRKKCGECNESFRSFSLIIEHLRSAHEYDKCLSCTTCEEYFPNRQTFVNHRKEMHADVQQCRCENCEVFFTYVEFKHHERECFAVDPTERDSVRSKRPIQNRNKGYGEEPDSAQLIRPVEDIPSEVVNLGQGDNTEVTVQELQLEAGNVLGQILESEHSILEQTKALVSVKTKDSEKVKHSASRHKADGEENKSGEDEREDEEEEDNDGDSENGESEDATSMGDGDLGDGEVSLGDGEASLGDGDASDILSSIVSEAVQNAIKGNTSWDLSYPRSMIQEKSTALGCQGPFRCQTCYFVVEKFEDFERHCYEMHSRYVCTYCAQTFANRRNLQRHIRRHIGDMPYVCNECGQRFYRDDNLRRHKLKHMTSIKFICAYCNLPCETKNKLTSHLIGGHAIDVLKVTEQEMMKHVVLKDAPFPESDIVLD